MEHFPIDGLSTDDLSTTAAARLRKVADGDVFNYVTVAMKLTRGKLLKTDNWEEW